VLLVGAAGTPWRATADVLRVPVAVHSLGADALTMFGVTPDGARHWYAHTFRCPAGSVAAAQDPGRTLAAMLDRALARS
jgi:hypothetical protein